MNKILAPDAGRIAKEAGPLIEKIYNETGLICFREEYQAGSSGQTLVREGYIDEKILPNGTALQRKIVTRTITRKTAEEEA